MDTVNERMRAALELLRFKAVSQMCQGKSTCTIDERDVMEVLFLAGMQIDSAMGKDVEVM